MRTDFLHKATEAAPMAEELIQSSAAMNMKVAATDSAYLKGTYSSAFVCEMAAQLTSEIENRLLVSGLSKSDITLELVFAPGTYMEHPQGEYTYRRLLISENGRARKDLWVRWRRMGEGKNFTVCDDVTSAEIRFSLGEDVPQKVREKEYRFLVLADPEQYRAAMGRKNVTEWREIIKRAVKRGTLEKITIDDKVAEHAGLIKDKLEELLGKVAPAPAPEPKIKATEPEADEAYEKAMQYMRSFVENAAKPVEEEEAEIAVEETSATEDAETETVEEVAEEAEATEAESEKEIDATEEIEEAAEEEIEETIEAEAIKGVAVTAVNEDFEAESKRITFAKAADTTLDIAALRAEMESELRAEMEAKERELQQREYALERQKQALASEIREHEINRVERENEVRRQAQNQARLEWEARERDRLAAQARLAVEARKIEEARAAEEARKAEEARLAEEARKAEEARLAEEARKAEEARLAEEARKAEEARLAEEARKAEEARLAEEARKAEEARLAEEAAEPQIIYTYTEKLVHLIFRHPVDRNVMGRIQDLMTDTIRYFKKENVFIKVKASIPAEDTVDLHFTQFPEEENQLLIDMIKVLGNSDLGICRVLVD